MLGERRHHDDRIVPAQEAGYAVGEFGSAAANLVRIAGFNHRQSPFLREDSRLMTIYLKSVADHHPRDARMLGGPVRKSFAHLFGSRVDSRGLRILLREASL